MVSSAAPILLLGLAGLLFGGSWSLWRQGASRTVVTITALLGVVALAGGIAWMLPEGA